jgi:hypothetical protein
MMRTLPNVEDDGENAQTLPSPIVSRRGMTLAFGKAPAKNFILLVFPCYYLKEANLLGVVLSLSLVLGSNKYE